MDGLRERVAALRDRLLKDKGTPDESWRPDSEFAGFLDAILSSSHAPASEVERVALEYAGPAGGMKPSAEPVKGNPDVLNAISEAGKAETAWKLRWYPWTCINGHHHDQAKLAPDGTKMCAEPGCHAEAECAEPPKETP